jgi:hypothetical protein
MNLPSYEEEDAVRRVLRHHGVRVDRELVNALGELLAWVREDQKSKDWPMNNAAPPLLLAKLSTMGIYGSEAINKVPTEAAPAP